MCSDLDNNIIVDQIKFDDLNTFQLEQLKSLFNYTSPNTIEDRKFLEAYNKWLAKKQMGFIVNSRLQVKIIPLKADLSLDSGESKYLHTSQIHSLNLKFECYGFNGKLVFNIPYSSREESLWNNLFNHHNKFAIEIYYQEDKNENGKYKLNEENNWRLRGYVDINESNAIELNDEVSAAANGDDFIHYLSCKLVFVDAFGFIAKQHWPIKIYPRITYKKLFENIFKNFSSLLKLKIDDTIKILDDEYNWICINCSYPDNSFYNFFFYTLKHYKLQLIYDYSSLEPSYSIQDFNNLKDSGKSVTIPNGIIQRITKIVGDLDLANVNLVNHHWSKKEQSDLATIDITNSIPISRDRISSYPVISQFQKYHTYYQDNITTSLKQKNGLILDWKYFPSEFLILPLNQFIFPDKYKENYSNYDTALTILNTCISFTKYNQSTIYAGQTSQLIVTSKAKDVSDKNYSLDHGIQIKTKIYPVNQEPLAYPNINNKIKPLNIYGWIDDLNNSGKDNVYFISPGDKSEPKDINIDTTAPERSSCPMHDHTTKELSYVVKLPPNLKGSSSENFYITLPFFVSQDHQIMPLRKGTPVSISLNQEEGFIDKIMWHSMQDKSFNKNKQINKLTFGANDSAGIIHQAEIQKIREGSLEIFTETSKNKTKLISDKDHMSLIYSEDESD